MMRTFPIPAMFERRGSGIWTPARLGQQFSNFAWLEPNPITVLAQDAAGTTPVTATGQVVGLVRDQSQGLALGPELVVNGGFDVNAAGWATNGLVVSQEIALYATGGFCYQDVAVTPGIPHLVSFNSHKSGASNGVLYISDGANNGFALGVILISDAYTWRSQIVKPTQSAIRLFCSNTTTGTISYFDNISAREVLGGIASQSTTANKPTYQLSPQGSPVLRHDTTDVLTLTAASSLGAAASVYYSNATGVQQTHNVNVGSSYNLPGAPGAGTADVYGWIITPTRPDQVTENRIIKYLSRKANV